MNNGYCEAINTDPELDKPVYCGLPQGHVGNHVWAEIDKESHPIYGQEGNWSDPGEY